METKRIALFAHYDRDGLIDDYVIYYLQGLKQVAQRILFVSNCSLAEGEAAKLGGLAELVSAFQHNEYDFGSWKRAFEHIHYDLTGWDEVIIANDSCYAPLTPLPDLFAHMDKVDCEVWSPNAYIAGKGVDHLNAYFMVLRCVPGMQETLQAFFSRVDNEPDYIQRFQRFEIGLSRAVWAKGFRGGALITRPYETLTLKEYLLCVPFIKVRVLRDNPSFVIKLSDILTQIEKTYPRELIAKHMQRMLGTTDPKCHHYKIIGRWNFNHFGVSIRSKIKRNKKRKAPRFMWWKIYCYLFGIPFFAFVWPVRNR